MVKGKDEIDLVSITERLIFPRRERTQRERPMNTRRIGDTVNIFAHRQRIDANDAAAHLNLPAELIK